MHSYVALYPPQSLAERQPSALGNALAWIRDQLPVLDWKDILPLGVEIFKGVVISGNASTPSLLVTEFTRAEGTYGLVESRSKFDFYKQMYNFKFEQASVRLDPNDKYQDAMTVTGRMAQERVAASK